MNCRHCASINKPRTIKHGIAVSETILMDRLHSMRAFVRVVDAGSFAAAAREMNQSPAVVTRLVADLEEHLGARLMNRTTRRLALTDIGEAYLERARDGAARLGGIVRAMSESSRIERAIEQRTTMLNGVSHDLRTILTRFRLSLAFLPEGPEVEDMKRDVDEMGRMLEAYLAFARGEASESAEPADIRALLEVFVADAERTGHIASLHVEGDPVVRVRPQAFRRLLGNLVANAARYGDKIEIVAVHDDRYLTVTVDDDGPGIPEEMREEVFKPFLRLDAARNQDGDAGTGLGLAIARDIARGHGGDVTLEDSPLGGLRARVRVPA